MTDQNKAPETDVKRWLAKRKAALVMEIWKAKTTTAQACREYDLTPSDLEEWVIEAQDGMKNSLRARPRDVKEQYDVKI